MVILQRYPVSEFMCPLNTRLSVPMQLRRRLIQLSWEEEEWVMLRGTCVIDLRRRLINGSVSTYVLANAPCA